uniref:Uncharacterized protein n=1 Tax=Arundo donax TaxID=35708 RepID=A0A0A9FVJ6_ARUDO
MHSSKLVLAKKKLQEKTSYFCCSKGNGSAVDVKLQIKNMAQYFGS